MRPLPPHPLPPDRESALRRARRLEWTTVAYLISVTIVMYLVMGSSQAMKTAWLEDVLSLVPSIAFLIASPISRRPATPSYPYGFHRATSIAFLCGAVALFGMGLMLVFEAAMKLIRAEHTTIGLATPFDQPVWLGWLMLPALAWSAIPASILGRRKLPLARTLHDNVLYVDAEMNRADWLTAAAAAAGVIGVGFGLWWADATAAAFISVEITRDGYRNVRHVTEILLNRKPRVVDGDAEESLPERVRTYLRGLPWVVDADLRMRNAGHVFVAEAFVVPRETRDLPARLAEAAQGARALDWRLLDLTIMPVPSLEVPDIAAEHLRGRRD